jgi:hypothetical protein
MVPVRGLPSSRQFYPKQALKVYFIHSSLFLLPLPMSISVDRCLFLCFRDDLEYHRVSVSQEVFVGYDYIFVNGVGLASLELLLLQVYSVYHHFCLSLYGHISNAK